MTTLIETAEVSKAYGSFLALDRVSLAVGAGEFVSIVGPNGAGKTTLVNLLTGLLVPSAGQVRFKGRDIAGVGPVALAKLGMARSFQLVNVFANLSVRETIAVGVVSRLGRSGSWWRSLSRDRTIAEPVERVAQLFQLAPKLDAKVAALSQGEKKLLDVASAFALEPEVILMDEPTSGVSTGDKHTIMRLLVDGARAVGVQAIIQVEHDMDLVEQYSDRVIALHEGRVLADAAPDAFFADARLIATVIGKRRSQEPGVGRQEGKIPDS
jgi:branched-chain amino acid transport system ATP-binding protein